MVKLPPDGRVIVSAPDPPVIVSTLETLATLATLFSVKLSNEVLARKRAESTALFATLLGQHAGDALQLRANDYLRATSHFAVGGVTQTISAWLSGEITYSPEQLIDQLRSMLDALAGMQQPGG